MQTIPLRTHLVPRDPLNPTIPTNRGKASEGEISAALRSTLVQMWLGSQRTYDPSLLFNTIASKVRRFRGRQQQDSHELLRYLMDEVDTEILSKLKQYQKEYLGKPFPPRIPSSTDSEGDNGAEQEKNDKAPLSDSVSSEAAPSRAEPKVFTLDFFVKRSAGNLVPNESWNLASFETDSKAGLVTYIDSMFGGRVESTLMCHSCGTTSATFETFLDLSVPIPVRFLDERIKRSIGLLPSLTQSSKNVKFSAQSRSQLKRSLKAAKNNANSFADLDDQNESEEPQTVSYKTDYDCETLSSLGSANREIGKKGKTNNVPVQPKLTAQQAMLKVKTRLGALQQKQANASGGESKKTGRKQTPKKLNKRERKAAQLRQNAVSSTLDLPPIDLSHLSEAQIMQLALADESQDLELMLEAMTNGNDSEVEKDTNETKHAESAENKEDQVEKEEESDEKQNLASTEMPGDEKDENGSNIVLNQNETTVACESADNIENGANLESSVSGESEELKAEDSSSKLENKEIVPDISSEELSKEDEKVEEKVETENLSTENESNQVESSISVSTATQDTEKSSIQEDGEKSEAAEIENSKDAASSEPNGTTSEGESKKPEETKSEAEPAAKPPSTNGLNPNLKHDARTTSRPMGLTIDACLYEFTEPEILSGSNSYGCYECTKRQFLKEGKSLAPLILAYGSDEEKNQLKQQSESSSSSLQSSPNHSDNKAKNDLESELSNEVSSVSLSTDTEVSDNVESTSEEKKKIEAESTEEAHTIVDGEKNQSSDETEGESKKSEGENKKTEGENKKSEGENNDSEQNNNGESGEEDEEANSSEEESEESEEMEEKEKDEESKAIEEEKKKMHQKKNQIVETSIPLVKSVATKQILIDEVPQILTLHIKRFWTTMSGSAKLDHKIEFPTLLDLAPYLSRSARKRFAEDFEGEIIVDKDGHKTIRKPKNRINLNSVLYQLYGIVVHSGSMSGGHYVAYTRRRENPISDMSSLDDFKSGWNYFSDSTTCNATLESVLSQQAYILFYERVSD